MFVAAASRVVEHSLEAQALNCEQDRLIANDTPELDSIAEHAQQLLRLTAGAGEARAHVCEIIRLASRLRSSNSAERDCLRAIPPLVEHRGRGIRAAQRALRDPLADLLNPMVSGPARDLAAEQVRWVLENFPASTLRSDQLCNDIGARKFALLQRLLAEAPAVMV